MTAKAKEVPPVTAIVAHPRDATSWRGAIEAAEAGIIIQLTPDKLILTARLALPVVRITNSPNTVRGVHLSDLAVDVDKQRAKALKECQQLGRAA
jgi:hypothetical protein